MIDVNLSKECREVMRLFGVPLDRAQRTINDRHHGYLVPANPPRIVAAHWFSDQEIILVEGVVSKRQAVGRRHTLKEVTASLCIELRPELPGGTLDRGMDLPKVLGVTARSFGVPISCHKDEPFSTLYTGRWDGGVRGKGQPPSFVPLFASASPSGDSCELVWMFDVESYKRWWEEHVRRPPDHSDTVN